MAEDKYYIDETFDIDNCQNYILSIRCSLDGFSFCIYDSIIQKFTVLCRYHLNAINAFQLGNEIKEIIQKEAILQANYKKVIFSFQNGRFFEVPAIVYNKTYRTTLFENTIGRTIDESVLSYNLDERVCIFSIPKSIHNLFLDRFTNCTFVPEFLAINKNIGQLKTKATNVLVNQEGRSAYICVYKTHETIYQNTFIVHTLDDLLYYVLKVYTDLELSNETPLHLIGNYTDLDAVKKNFLKFITKVETASYRPGYSVSYTFREELPLNHISIIEQTL